MTTAHNSTGLSGRYRAWYEKLPIGIQMIGMQLWMPIFFVFAFVFCYVFAFHAPAFHNVPVALVGASSTMQPVAEQLETSSKHAVEVSVVPDLAEARAQVREGKIAAAYAPATGSAKLVIASAAGYQLANLAKNFFQTVATQSQAELTVSDLAPLPSWDSFGTSLFYLTLVCTITSHLTAMFVGMMGARLKHWQRYAIFGAASVVLSGITLLLSRFLIHAVNGNVLWLWLIGAATGFAVGCVVNGLAYFTGRFVAAYALLLFVFLNVPGSGGAYPPELLPQPFRFLHPFVTGTATINLFRRHEYGVGPAQWHGWLLLACYAAAGTILALTGKPFLRWKAERRTALGKRPPMMVTAQAASLIHAGFVAPLAPSPAIAPQDESPRGADADEGADARTEPQRKKNPPQSAAAPEWREQGRRGRHAAPVDDKVLSAETAALEIAQKDALDEFQPSAEEADVDAAAAETGAAG